MKLTITAEGVDEREVAEAAHEALKRFEVGNTSGFDRTELSSFNFEVTES